MPFFSWGRRRQFAVFTIFAIAVILAVVGLIYYFQPVPSCFDNRQNQGEEGTDCGGTNCAPCSEKIHDLTILWTRFFPVREGVYDVASMVQNDNQFLKTKKFVYAVKLYDENNVLIAIRENTTFIQPGEKFLIFEPNVEAQHRVPKNAILEMRGVTWEGAEPSPLKIDILGKNILLEDAVSPRLEVRIKNQAAETYKNIEASAVLYGDNDTALGASKTVIDALAIAQEKNIVFTWPEPVKGVVRAEVLLRQIP